MPFKPPPQPTCQRCNKAVYPTELLKCLDKTWHKLCFDCEVCHTKLNMNTYRGFEGLPYCKTHYPQGKFTAVADTPESVRLKAQQERQSVVAYHRQYEADKGKYQGTAEGDRNTQTAIATTHKTSGVEYRTAPSEVAAPSTTNKPKSAEASKPAASAAVSAPTKAAPAAKQPETEPEPPKATPKAAAGGKRHKSLYDYEATDNDEVSFKENDIIVEVEVIDDGWVKGTVESSGKRGMLPSNYIEEVTGEAPSSGGGGASEVPAAPAEEKWVAQYDYEATDGDEVSFKEGDIIVNVEVIDDGWVKGTVKTSGARGMLPSNYIEKQA